MKLWDWFDGKKTNIGATILLITTLVNEFPVDQVSQVSLAAGQIVTSVGLIFKFFKSRL
jgi:hypothetical protein